MSATFAAPVASVLLAVELLLFEWKPRSLIPVALASAVAAVARRYLLGFGPLFPVPEHPLFIGPKGLLGCVLVGLLAGGLSALLTVSVYAAEDAFQNLPIHWMWWPAIGGLAIGVGGLIFPQALGVGYDTIGELAARKRDDARDSRRAAGEMVYLGGVARLGHVGRRAGAAADDGRSAGRAEAMFLPNEGAGFWPLISMGAFLGGTMRSPFTGIIFAFELTHDANVFLPLLVGSLMAHAFTVLTLKRSILTEKVARRGYPLEPRVCGGSAGDFVCARSDAHRKWWRCPPQARLRDIQAFAEIRSSIRKQRLLPVVNADGTLVGVLTRSDIRERIDHEGGEAATRRTLREWCAQRRVRRYPDEPLRRWCIGWRRMGFTRMPVVERETRKFLGLGFVGRSVEGAGAASRRRAPPRAALKFSFAFYPNTPRNEESKFRSIREFATRANRIYK